MFKPADIENRTFTTTRLKEGYSQDEVDAFLDLVAQDYTNFGRQIADLQDRTMVLQRPVAAAPPSPVVVEPSLDAVKRVLVTAEATAEQLVAEAREEAARVAAEAAADADRTRQQARDEATQIVGAAHNERQATITQLEARQAELAKSVQGLQDRQTYYRQWVKSALDAFNAETVKEVPGG
ncbi:DivIVA domain-containing protein [Streptomyces sp. NPDC055085]